MDGLLKYQPFCNAWVNPHDEEFVAQIPLMSQMGVIKKNCKLV